MYKYDFLMHYSVEVTHHDFYISLGYSLPKKILLIGMNFRSEYK